MLFSDSRFARSLRAGLMAGSSLGLFAALPALAAESDHVIVQTTPADDYKVDTSSIIKLPEPLLDTPQTIDTVSAQVIQDRAAETLNDVFRNIPGITIGAGEFRSIGTSPTIRGFSARDDMYLDGLRDFGNYYRDPFALEDVEVLEGPSSILFGRGSTGGAIEQTSKLAKLGQVLSGEVTFGTDATKRVVADANEELSDLGEGAAGRLVVMGHDAGVTDRDDVHYGRYGFAPSLALGLGTPTRLTLSYFHQTNDDIPDYGIPYLGSQPAAVPRNNFYGFKSDYMDTGTDVVTFKAEHDFDGFTLSNQARYANYTRNFRFTEPLIATTVPATTPLSQVTVSRNVNTGTGKDTMLWDQLVGTAKFQTGMFANDLMAGMEGGHETSAPTFYNSAGVPSLPLLNPDTNAQFTATATYPRFATHLDADSFAPFATDTLKWGTQLELTLGVRWDYFKVNYNDTNYSTTNFGAVTGTNHFTPLTEMASPRAALTYKPVSNGSVYFSYGTSFDPSAEDLSLITSSRSFALSNADLAPEKNKSFEFGTKWDLFDNRLAVTGAVFRTDKDNARVPDPTNSALNVLAGDWRVDGVEVSAVGHITAEWQVQAGYAYLDDKVIKSAAGAAPVGSPLMNTPQNSFTFWTTYDLAAFEFGAGGRYASSQFTQNVPPIKTVPGFWAFDAMGKYAITRQASFQVNVTNLFNKYYYDQLHFFHVVPAEGRTALFSFLYKY